MSAYDCISCDITVTNPSGDSVRFRQCVGVEIDTSYDTVTDTAKVTLPKDQRWHVNDENGLNTYVLLDSDGFQERGLFQPGDRIVIKLGYNFDDKVVFNGYVTGIDASTPFTLLCEDAAWLLKKNFVNFSSKLNTKLEELIPFILGNTGVQLHPDSITDIELGKVSIRRASSAKVLNGLKKKGVIAFIKDDQLLVGRSNFSNSANIMKTSETGYNPPTFNMEYDVVSDSLRLNTLDKRSILVRAESILRSNKRIIMDVVIDPSQKDDQLIIVDYKDGRKPNSQDDLFNDVENETGQVIIENQNKLIDPDGYQVRTLTVNSIDDIGNIFEEAKGFFFKIVDTGFDGDFVAFGDHNLQPATTVNIIDPSNTEKNGEFIVKSVKKTWGQRGYRQVVKIPHKFKNFE